jgi:elongation factor Ts
MMDLIQKLRQKTGARIIDCKKALEEVGAELEAAEEWLRKKGVLNALKKSDRETTEGCVAVAAEGDFGVLVQVNCETDFVARNNDFQKSVASFLETAFQHRCGSIEDLENATDQGHTIKEHLLQLSGRIGEKIALGRVGSLQVHPGVVVGYVHSALAPRLGALGVLVALESEGDKEALQALGKSIAMHVAALNPSYIHQSQVPQHVLDKEKEILTAQVEGSGKPPLVIEKMIAGRLSKFLEEVVLEEQSLISEPSKKVKDVLQEKAKEVGSSIKIAGILRFSLK